VQLAQLTGLGVQMKLLEHAQLELLVRQPPLQLELLMLSLSHQMSLCQQLSSSQQLSLRRLFSQQPF
jgi:hypothetical protein